MIYAVESNSIYMIADAIREKGGTTSPLVFPSGFVSAIGDIQTGGVYAFFLVTANTGTVITCTETTTGRTTPAIPYDGKTLFEIPSAGTWRVDVASGGVITRTVTQTVGESDRGKSYSFNLAKFYIVENGEQIIQLSRYIRSSVTFSRSTSGGVLTLTGSSDSATCGVSTASKVDLSPYTRLVAEVTSATKTGYTYSQLVVWNDNTGSTESAVNNARERGTDIPANGGTIVVDISSYTTSKYVGFHSHVDSGKPTIKLTNMYLE